MVASGFEGMTFRGHPSHHIRQLDVGRVRENERRGGGLEEEAGRLAGVVTTPPFFLLPYAPVSRPAVPLRPFWVFFRLFPTPEAFHTHTSHNHCSSRDGG